MMHFFARNPETLPSSFIQLGSSLHKTGCLEEMNFISRWITSFLAASLSILGLHQINQQQAHNLQPAIEKITTKIRYDVLWP